MARLKVSPERLGSMVYGVIRALGATLRVRIENDAPLRELDCGKIVCGWHGRSLIPGVAYRNRGYWVIVSHSRDGRMQTRIFERLGYRVIRGSTGRGGARAAIESIRALREKAIFAVTPDGPRGPSGIVQGGVMTMAQKSGAALMPVGVSGRPRARVNSWDRYFVPAPFAKGLMLYGEPIFVPADASPDEVEALRQRFEREIHRVQSLADRAMGYEGDPP